MQFSSSKLKSRKLPSDLSAESVAIDSPEAPKRGPGLSESHQHRPALIYHILYSIKASQLINGALLTDNEYSQRNGNREALDRS
jgi:hypothetical protein